MMRQEQIKFQCYVNLQPNVELINSFLSECQLI